MKKNKKNNIIIIVLAVILVAVCALVAYLAIDGKKEETTTTTTSEISVSETTTTAVSTTAVSTTQTTTDTTASTTQTTSQTQTQSDDPYPFIRQGCWYLADSDREVCYAFVFHKNGNADLAYFNSKNIEGLDPQYFKGDAKYEIKGNKIVFASLPSTMDIKKIELEIKENSIEYKGDKLRSFNKISLGNALECF